MNHQFYNLPAEPSTLDGTAILRLPAITALLLTLCIHWSSASHAADEENYQKSPIIIATFDYPPFASASLLGQGWAWQIAKAAFLAEGYRSSIKFYPWARALKLAENASIDGLFIANKTPEREQWALFTDQVGEERSVLWKRRENNLLYPLPANVRIGAISYSGQIESLKDAGYQPTSLNTFQQGLRMLKNGRIDLLLGDLYVIEKLLVEHSQEHRNDYEFLMPAWHTAPFYLASAKKLPRSQEIIEAFNRGLQKIKDDGSYQKIIRTYYDESASDSSLDADQK